MVFAMRRFRLFVLVVSLFAFAVYYFSRGDSLDFKWEDVGKPVLSHEPQTNLHNSQPNRPLPPPIADTTEETRKNAVPATSAALEVAIGQAEQTTVEERTTTAKAITRTKAAQKTHDSLPNPKYGEEGSGRYESDQNVIDGPQARWRKPVAHHPVAREDIKKLPSGPAKKLPKIQADFEKEAASSRKDRLRKLHTIKESFKHAWQGYKKHGLPHDEVRPISKSSKDPFMGWGATLVDTLDSLWIMGLKEEFEEALTYVENIDFHTSFRKDIPLFETVIRYLGGLLAAYDLSDAKYPVLLAKAEELAEVLIGAFDTPNRMPITFYNWAPSYTSQPHRAGTRVVMAELGSLSVEMTRLAQITGKHVYYDAIARITDALEEFQTETLIPGLWPLKIDASGCQKIARNNLGTSTSAITPVLDEDYAEDVDQSRPKADLNSGPAALNKEDVPRVKPNGRTASVPRDLHSEERNTDPRPPPVRIDQEILSADCTPQGLAAPPNALFQDFSLGGQADSTYEYLPKMYQLLKGKSDQYKTMYINSAKAMREDLLFRPMIKEQDRDILFAAKHEFIVNAESHKKKDSYVFEVTHLSCFLGGMFGLGAKLFDLPEDMSIAKQLTDGCVWAYESMPTGVMAEIAEVVPCPDTKGCAWNQTRWLEALDPKRSERFQAVEAWNRNQQLIYETSRREAAKEDQVKPPQPPQPQRTQPKAQPNLAPRTEDKSLPFEEPSRTTSKLAVEEADIEEPESDGSIRFVRKVALPHDKYVKARIQEERLPPSYTRINDRHYGLRPEAIESVFYMYRITGDNIWRQKGWKMFEAVQSATQTDTANAAMKDVTSNLGTLDDTMESFWLAETLKYFYLLFDDPSNLSLDEWVLNTEAHPMSLAGGPSSKYKQDLKVDQ